MEKPRVLVVDAQQEELNRVSNILESKGFEVIRTQNGFEAVFLFDKEAPQLVLTEWALPGLSGDQICQNIKSKKNNVPVIILTSQGTPENKRSGIQAGCDEFISKPCNFDELATKINDLVSRSQAASTGKLVYGDLVLDREAHRVSRGGRSIDMSVTEYRLLEYLMSNVDKVVTRKQILEHVWGTTNPTSFTNIVDVYINYLRKKVDSPGRRSVIKTVRGFGYMMEDIQHRRVA